MCELGHADTSVNDRYTLALERAHLAASEQRGELAGRRGKRHDRDGCSHVVLIRRRSSGVTVCKKGVHYSSVNYFE
jgi:hypothetical protein